MRIVLGNPLVNHFLFRLEELSVKISHRVLVVNIFFGSGRDQSINQALLALDLLHTVKVDLFILALELVVRFDEAFVLSFVLRNNLVHFAVIVSD